MLYRPVLTRRELSSLLLVTIVRWLSDRSCCFGQSIVQKQPGPRQTIKQCPRINYTSGATGNPKGVVLAHRNAVASTSRAMLVTKRGANDVICSFSLLHTSISVSQSTQLSGLEMRLVTLMGHLSIY